MKTRITEKQLRRFHRLLSVKMIDFNCGELCAPKNGGVPICCENDYVVPILFHEEFKWQRNNGKFWKRMSPKNRTIRKFIDESESYYVYSQCPGPEGCIRSKRSFTCMTFPFEPHVSRNGDILGLVYVNGDKSTCSLIGRPRKTYNPVYIANALKFWKELFALYPEEQELYIQESRKRENRKKRQRKRFSIFKTV